jgi:hypothetical protein
MSLNSDLIAAEKIIKALEKNQEVNIAKILAKSFDEITAVISAYAKKYADGGTWSKADMFKYDRYNKLLITLDDIARDRYKELSPLMLKGSSDVYRASYYRSAYAVGNNTALNINFSLLTAEQIKAIVNAPVTGIPLVGGAESRMSLKRYEALIKQREVVGSSIIRGDSEKQTIKALELAFENENYNMQRIARTENVRNQSTARLDAFTEAQNQGIEIRTIWSAALQPGRTREAHLSLNGVEADRNGLFYAFDKGRKYSAPAPGMFGVPALDINCRCSVRAELVGLEETPLDMTYDEWYQKNVQKD